MAATAGQKPWTEEHGSLGGADPFNHQAVVRQPKRCLSPLPEHCYGPMETSQSNTQTFALRAALHLVSNNVL